VSAFLRKVREGNKPELSSLQVRYGIFISFQVQSRTGEGRLHEELGKVLAGLLRLGKGQILLAQGSQSIIKDLIGTPKMPALDFLLDNPLLLGFELNRHEK